MAGQGLVCISEEKAFVGMIQHLLKKKKIQRQYMMHNSRTTKLVTLVRQLSCQNVNIGQVALKNGFISVQELGDYMKGQGYVWDNKQNNYKYDEIVGRKVEDLTDSTNTDTVAAATVVTNGK